MSNSRYRRWPERDPVKNCFLLPNEIFCLGLSGGAILVYSYLLYCEDRKTYQCYPGYRTIGRHVDMSVNTVKKYVTELVERGLVSTESTTVTTRDGKRRNGSLRYTIRPIQEAVERYYERQFAELARTAAAERARRRSERQP